MRNLYCTALFIQWLRNPVHLRNLYWTILYLFSDLTKPVNLGNLYCTASFIQWSDEYSKSKVPILTCFIYSVIWGIQWIWGTFTELLYLFNNQRNPVNQTNLYCTALIIQWSDEYSEHEEPILYYLFSDQRNPVNLRNQYCSAIFIQWSEESSESEEPILNCFIYSVIWGLQWIWGTYTELLYLFNDLKFPMNLRNLYCTDSFIQWSEESSESEEP